MCDGPAAVKVYYVCPALAAGVGCYVFITCVTLPSSIINTVPGFSTILVTGADGLIFCVAESPFLQTYVLLLYTIILHYIYAGRTGN